MLRDYLPAIVFLILGSVVGLLFATLNMLVSRRVPNRSKLEPYECGLPSEVRRGFRFGISFYLVAMLFILFDLEIVFMYPWAVVYKDAIAHNGVIFWSMLSFITILMVGYVYALKKGALDFRK